MSNTVTEIVLVVMGLIGIPLFIYTIQHSTSASIRLKGFYVWSLLLSVLLIIGGIWMFVYDSGFFRNKQLISIDIDVSSNNAESTSILFLFDEMQGNITPTDVDNKLNLYYLEEDDSSYSMIYRNPSYTLNGIRADRLTFIFNSKRTVIHNIVWKSKEITEKEYIDVLTYLTSVLGDPIKKNTTSTRWQGFILYVSENRNKYTLYFHREF